MNNEREITVYVDDFGITYPVDRFIDIMQGVLEHIETTKHYSYHVKFMDVGGVRLPSWIERIDPAEHGGYVPEMTKGQIRTNEYFNARPHVYIKVLGSLMHPMFQENFIANMKTNLSVLMTTQFPSYQLHYTPDGVVLMQSGTLIFHGENLN